jgi:hypothetical protein
MKVVMNRGACAFAGRIGSFVDGELSGADRMRVSQHLVSCASCADDVEALEGIGRSLRAAAASQPIPELAGLADGIVSRVGAEAGQSWRARLDAALQDMRWAVVGSGSVAATALCTLFVCVIVWQGPANERDDSLAAMMRNLGSYSGALMLVASPEGGNQLDSTVMLVDKGGRRRMPAVPAMLLGPEHYQFASQSYLVGKLTDVVTREGRLVDLASMREPDRREAEALLNELSRRGGVEPSRTAYSTVVVHSVHLVAEPVTVKGL